MGRQWKSQHRYIQSGDIVYKFDPVKEKHRCIEWIRELFEYNPAFVGKNAVLGMSGGKDSTIAAALIAEAIGPDRVIGIAMPDKNQGINEADEICKHLGIRYMYMPIEGITDGFDRMWYFLGDEDFKWTNQSLQNIPPRIRMTMLYAVAQTFNGMVVNTCNLSEDTLGYSTIYGDLAGAFSPTKGLTVTELLAIGDLLDVPSKWIHKTPDDGLPHSCPDEEKFGFSYEVLDKYICEGITPIGFDGTDVTEKILEMWNRNAFKEEAVHINSFEPRVYHHTYISDYCDNEKEDGIH